MKKSELRKYISEALTPDEASKVEPKYKETYAAMIRGKGPLKLKKYDNPDKVVLGRVINNLKESTRRTNERLEVAIKEVFSEKQRKYMCVMAQPGAKRPKGLSKADAKEMCADTKLSKAKQEEQALEEIDAIMKEDELTKSEKNKLKKVSSQLKKSVKAHDRQSKIIDKAISETGGDIAKTNMEKYREGNMKKNRLTELVKSALMGPVKEANAYIMAADKARDAGKKEFEFPKGSGKMHPVKLKADIDEDKMTPEERALDRKIRRAYGLDKGAPDPDMPHFKNIFKDDAITIPNLKEEDIDESFKSLSKDIDKQKGKTKEDGDNIAGFIANRKREGAGKGPTKKMKKREGIKERILKELRGQ